jgi:hypothetical protein
MALLREWHRSDIKNKAVLAVFFIPAMLSVAGLVICIAYFVLFKLPSFILSVLGWLLLISLFSGGGLFCYEKMSGKRVPNDSPDYYDVPPAEDGEKDKKKWFDDKKIWLKGAKWFKK